MRRPTSERPAAGTIFSHLGGMLIAAVVLGVVVSGLAIPFAGLVGFGAKEAAQGVDELPQDFEADALPQTTTILDSQGGVLARIFEQNRTNVALDDVSPVMKKAILSIEDFRFYQHGALDVKGTARAFVTNQASGGVTQGGSSITQQLVKLTLVNRAGDDLAARAAATDDSYARKIRELRYAIALEDQHSKDWILERYLNTAYFGAGSYGIQAAAQRYFGVDAKDLDVRQSALLAGLVQNPSQYDPTQDPDAAIERRNVVLDRMGQLRAIGAKRADAAKKKNLGLDVQPLNNGCNSSYAPFFCQYALAWLVADPSLGKNAREREQMLKTGGLTIQTTVDPRVQKAADDAVRANVFQTDTAVGAISMVEPGTGAVKAVAQSRPIGNDVDAGETYLNYTVPSRYGNANGFQPGSTFKAFVLASALEQGIPTSFSYNAVSDTPHPASNYETCDGPYYGEDWAPGNSTGDGTFNMYTGTQQSVNQYFAELEEQTGLCEPYRLAKAMGIRLSDPDTEMVPSFTLGVADVSPLEMAEAYATFGARGMHCTSQPVTEIKANSGKVLKTYDPSCSQVMPSAVADRVNDILSGVTAPGGFGSAISIPDGRDDAGKTGTINESRAVWFSGYTPDMAAAVVVSGVDDFGNQIGLDGVQVGPNYIYSASGSTTAGPIWGDAMAAAAPFFGSDSFNPPSDPGRVDVPDVTGLSLADAQRMLTENGFAAQVGNYRASGEDRDLVAATAPKAGGDLNPGDTVTLYPSSGPQNRS